ncbi:hypothetical protein [Marinimicrobium locisalis]|uniref:hypothetical protein n=1 Tax=Marinimicrobium locisalis TaxID=546022 RepID=UPI0032215053
MRASTGQSRESGRFSDREAEFEWRHNHLLGELLRLQLETEGYFSEAQQLDRELLEANLQLDKCSGKLKRMNRLVGRAEEAVYSAHLQVRRGAFRWFFDLITRFRPSRLRVRRQVSLVLTSELFDVKWYALRNPDVALSARNLAEHYTLYGGIEGRAPGPAFSSRRYLERYPDVAESRQNPLVHYLMFGQSEGRKRFKPTVNE